LNESHKPFYVSSADAPAKQKIMIVALELFVQDGLCETSIRDIAKASGFTNPALFKHFPSKDALAKHLFERCYLELFHLISTAVRRGNTFAEKQRAIIDVYLAALDRDRNSVLYVQDGLRHFWPGVSVEVRKHSIIGEVQSLLSLGRKEGAVTRAIDIKMLTIAWIGTLQQFARARYFGEFRESAKVLASALDELLTKMVAI
jgi:AcrR family transcriptional regulator